jgi:methylase of polypeptide subunit release factors/ribosomal 50S subunit-recycling heat shock protein
MASVAHRTEVHAVPRGEDRDVVWEQPLATYLTRVAFPNIVHSRTLSKKLIRQGHVKVDGEVTRNNSTALKPGQTITLVLPLSDDNTCKSKLKTEKDLRLQRDSREERIASQVCTSCQVLKSTSKLSILHKPCGVGMDLVSALPRLLPTASRPNLVLPLDKAADGLVLCSNCDGADALNGFHIMVTFNLLVVCESADSVPPLFPPTKWPQTLYTCTPVGDLIHSNTDGLLRQIEVTVGGRFVFTRKNQNECPATIPCSAGLQTVNQYDLQLKSVLLAAKALSWPVLGNSSSICARRRCSAGRGLFASLTGMSATDLEGSVTSAGVPVPKKFEALRLRETRFHVEAAPLPAFVPPAGLPPPPFTQFRLSTFSGLPIYCDPAVMKPCKSSTALVNFAVAYLKRDLPSENSERVITVVDAGTGSGCLLLACLAQMLASCTNASTTIRGVGLDISPEALSTAAYNASINKLSDQAEFHICEFKNMGAFLGLRGHDTVDVVMCNPPYHVEAKFNVGPSAESRKLDPGLALWGSGVDGLGCYADIAKGVQGAAALRAGCMVVVEVPSKKAADFVSGAFAEDGEFLELERIHVPQKGGVQLLRAVAFRKVAHEGHVTNHANNA